MDYLVFELIVVTFIPQYVTVAMVKGYNGPFDKIWPIDLCRHVKLYRNDTKLKPEDCIDECIRVSECSAFNYNNNSGFCALRNCYLPVPEPTSIVNGYIGYAFDPEKKITGQKSTSMKSTTPSSEDAEESTLIFPAKEIKANMGEMVQLHCGSKVETRRCVWEDSLGNDLQVEDVINGEYNGTYGEPSNAENNQCGITIQNVTRAHQGVWTCKILVSRDPLSDSLTLIVHEKESNVARSGEVERRDEEEDQFMLVIYCSAAVLGIVVLMFVAAGLYMYCSRNNDKQQSAVQPENVPHSTPMGMLNRHVSENSLYMANTNETTATTSPRSRHDSENSLYESFSKNAEAETNVNRGSRHDSENSLYASARQ